MTEIEAAKEHCLLSELTLRELGLCTLCSKRFLGIIDYDVYKNFQESSNLEGVEEQNDSQDELVEPFSSEVTDDIEEFEYESDHPALKANKDVCNLLNTFAALEFQRSQAVADLEFLYELRRKADQNPDEFIKELSTLKTPAAQDVSEIPDIDWSQYEANTDKRDLLGSKRDEKRIARASATSSKLWLTSSTSTASTSSKNTTEKPSTHNQPWTLEEQEKLEQLLIKYPPEPVEMRRFAKIADELENRTLPQVCSRIQKYFIKLAKAGLPVPGRMPNLASYKSLANRSSRRTFNSHLQSARGYGSVMAKSKQQQFHISSMLKSSTFFSSRVAPFLMPETDVDDTVAGVAGPDTEQELAMLRAARERKLRAQGQFVESENSSNSTTLDPDYVITEESTANYLDPNYMPATN